MIEALEQMPDYTKFMNDMAAKKRSVSFEDDNHMQQSSAISTRSLMQKREDPGSFTISCTIGLLHFAKVVCDVGTHINLMHLYIYKNFGFG